MSVARPGFERRVLGGHGNVVYPPAGLADRPELVPQHDYYVGLTATSRRAVAFCHCVCCNLLSFCSAVSTMNRSVIIALLVFVICLLPLVLGAEPVVLLTLPGDLPVGTLLAALALSAGALIPAIASTGLMFLRLAGSVLLIAALPWLPLGIYLSGDAHLNFGRDSIGSDVFWAYTFALFALVLLFVNATLLALVWRWYGAGKRTEGRIHQ
jgi:hypothetical protein